MRDASGFPGGIGGGPLSAYVWAIPGFGIVASLSVFLGALQLPHRTKKRNMIYLGLIGFGLLSYGIAAAISFNAV